MCLLVFVLLLVIVSVSTSSCISKVSVISMSISSDTSTRCYTNGTYCIDYLEGGGSCD
jgi:hypothetical protein